MTPLNESDIAKTLRGKRPVPPPGLVDAIIDEIPEVERRRRTWPWLLASGAAAASLFLGVLVSHDRQEGIAEIIDRARVTPPPPSEVSRSAPPSIILPAPEPPKPEETGWRVLPGVGGGFGGGVYATEAEALASIAVEETITVTGETPLSDVRASARSASFDEPNDAVYDRVYFEGYGAHPFVDTEDDPRSTFALDVDTGSYTIARRVLRDGNLPDDDSVRVEEFLNYFDYGDPPPTENDFSIHLEAAPSRFASTARTSLLRIGIQARTVDPADRRPAVLSFLVDVSGSMDRENRLGLVRRGLHLLLDQLTADDRVGLVVFGSDARVLLAPTSDLDELRRAIDELRPEGSTNLEAGLIEAYEMASGAHREGASNRVILCSDGVANQGATGWESLLTRISDASERGIELSTLGFGMGNYNDVLMEQLADNGNGRYAYIDTYAEARRVFEEEVTGLIETVAHDAKLQVAFEPDVIQSYRLLGYENRDVPDEDFRNDAVDAGEIGAGHRVNALYEIKLREDAETRKAWASVSLRYRRPGGDEFDEVHRIMTRADAAASWTDAPASLKLAGIVAEFADLLRGSFWARSTLDDVFIEAQRLQPEFPGRSDIAELTSLIGAARDLQ